MTTFTPDRPDWTREDTASIVYQQEEFIAGGASFDFGLVGVASYIILAETVDPDEFLALTCLYQLAPNSLVPIMELAVTADTDNGFSALLVLESPSYGGIVTIANLNTLATVLVNVFSSNRIVEAPRYTLDSTPGRVFVSTAGFVADTPLFLPFVDGFGGGYSANVNAGITIDSTGDGTLLFAYRDGTGTQRMIPVAKVVGGVISTVTVPLPFCVGQFYFTPAATDPTGTITVQAYPARS